MYASWEITQNDLWKSWKEKRFKLIQNTEYEDELIRLSLGDRISPEEITKVLQKIDDARQYRSMNMEVTNAELIKMLKWEREKPEWMFQIIYSIHLYDEVKKSMLPDICIAVTLK
jgi:hypothetical protein